jgi:hypothetical protein
MKQIILAISVAFAFTACSEDNISIGPDLQGIDEDQAYISVYVAVEDLEASSGGCAEGTYVHHLGNAQVLLHYLDEERPISQDAILIGYTDKGGYMVFDDLPQGNYNVTVISIFGTEQQDIYASKGKVTKVFVRF